MGRADVRANRVRSYRRRLGEAVKVKLDIWLFRKLLVDGIIRESSDPVRDKVLV